MEHIINAEIIHYLRTHNVISKQQHGFLSRKSTSTNLLETLNDWTLAMKDRKSVTAVYIDYCKAFDSVSIDKLLSKLFSYGIMGNLLQWIKSFLSNRTQQTRVGNALSTVELLTSGVVQGSVLGPHLFLLFIDDLCRILSKDKCVCKLYADDVKLYTVLQLREDCDSLQDELDALSTWSNAWQLRISYAKCSCMNVSQKENNSICQQLTLNGHVLRTTNEVKDLGVIIDNHLKFSTQIFNVVSKANARACLIHKCFLSRDVATLVRAFTTYVRRHLEYASIVWSPVYTKYIQRLESVQRRFTKKTAGSILLHLPRKTCEAQFGKFRATSTLF